MENLNKGKILVVEDEKSMREVLGILLEGEGYEVTLAAGGIDGMALLNRDIFDMAITDINMPKVNGFEILRKVRETSPDTLVIMITAFGTTESAIEAMQLGAYDYIHKPFKIDEIRLVVKKALEKRRLREEVSILREKIKTTYEFGNIFWKNPKMQELLGIIPRIAQSNSNVIITGESGTGKELVATAVHNLSTRKGKKFVDINCAAFPEGLLESELFGHMKGAFTGAAYNKQGLFEIADGGSVFLDEICEMSINLQAKLLRVLENSMFRRVGGTGDITVDVRIISATNQDIKEEISAGRFREDLYYRLNVVPLHIPPLRERKEDIPMLVEHFLKKFSFAERKVSPQVMKLFMEYPWKGNVRELENVIERIALLTDRDEIAIEDVPHEMFMFSEDAKYMQDLTKDGVDLDSIIEGMEKKYLLNALKITDGNKTEAARLLNLSFRSFRHRLSKYGIK
ncbi:MAG: Fis family transcriptional regulator [Nitrospirae bacterium RIFOXYB2_FULL_43_5]|nr:MAG: Fis family transcriptional regulator [Nitrospirae bacterium GWF2_44_13]OGW33608.1 MAG: Fis family transcriptional regulator [Nitrospirae bacterium GWD2_44_7]OGW63723.1 MAG: Fis family transcriptional regulator [Nitrospirae bacterium RIFOXYA2_FULL_44_9]OGW73675.1 MAG: Fis family transcriptional regulator [Nitrospirae bacterium RIFOXYB2_FULL_43_5]HBG92884.1 Fis family transcriptional regulator [Nitrospiraceae bacterium]